MNTAPETPVLRVVPLNLIRRHEEIDPLRVERLAGRIEADGIQVNPMVCFEAETGELVLLDGATRTSAMRGLGLEHAVVQIVDDSHIELETWHHVIRQCDRNELLTSIREQEGVALTDVVDAPLVHLSDERRFSIIGEGVSHNAALGSMVHGYLGHWPVSRVTDPTTEAVAWNFPDWSAVVEFPTLTVNDVIKAAVDGDYLPAGITRFIVEGRALRLNVDLGLLRSSATRDEKQEALDTLLEERAHAGRIRRYEETVFILDD